MLFCLSMESVGWSSAVILSVGVNWPFNVQMTEGSRKKQETGKLPISSISLSYLSQIYRALHIAISLPRTYLDKHIQGDCRWSHNISRWRSALKAIVRLKGSIKTSVSGEERFSEVVVIYLSITFLFFPRYLMRVIAHVHTCRCNVNLPWRRRRGLFVSSSLSGECFSICRVGMTKFLECFLLVHQHSDRVNTCCSSS